MAACRPEPRPLRYRVDDCDHCRMTLMDERYGGQLLTRTGKAYVFDSVECLAAYEQGGSVPSDAVHSLYVTDYGEPGALVPVDSALFLQSTQLLSPMGANVTAFRRMQDASGAQNVFGGDLLTWPQVRTFVATEWTWQPSDRPTGS